jgi:hypothetical protein
LAILSLPESMVPIRPGEMLGNQLVLLSLYSITVKPVWLQWELLLYDVMHVCSICTSVQLLVFSKESSVYCASVQIAVFHGEKEFCCSSLYIHTVAVVSLRLFDVAAAAV